MYLNFTFIFMIFHLTLKFKTNANFKLATINIWKKPLLFMKNNHYYLGEIAIIYEK